MTIPQRSLRCLKTMRNLADQRRNRSPATALMEMSVLANEKQRLDQESNAILRRQSEIAVRENEIVEKESRLRAIVDHQSLTSPVRSIPPTHRVKATEFRY